MYESGNISIEEFNLLWVFELCVAHTRHIDNSIDTLNYKMYGVCSMFHASSIYNCMYTFSISVLFNVLVYFTLYKDISKYHYIHV